MTARSTAVRLAQRVGLFAPARAALDRLSPAVRAESAPWRAFFQEFLRRGDLVFDVGANVGRRTRDLRWVGARVVAIEMNETCVKYLRARFPSVPVVMAAAGPAEGMKDAFISERNSVASTLSETFIERTTATGRFPEGMWPERRSVHVTTLDHLIGSYGHPRYIKVDTEGYDADVLQGLSSPVPYVSFEHIAELPDVLTQCIERLTGLGDYEFRALAHDEPRPIGPWTTGHVLIESVARRQDSFGDVLARLRSARTRADGAD